MAFIRDTWKEWDTGFAKDKKIRGLADVVAYAFTVLPPSTLKTLSRLAGWKNVELW